MKKGSGKKAKGKASEILDPGERELFLNAFYSGDFWTSPKEQVKLLRRVQKKRGGLDGRLDLHGLHPEDAYMAIKNFISEQLAKGHKSLLIIHGKGSGVLRDTVFSIIDSHPEVIDYQVAPARLGGTGAVILKVSHKYSGRRNF